MKSNQPQSFLHEFQLEGKASGSGKIALEDWEESLDGVSKITTLEAKKAFASTDWDRVPAPIMATYCHDCQAIVDSEIKKFHHGKRAVCGNCFSKKISSGREDALKKFYHLGENNEPTEKPKRMPRPKRDFSKPENQQRKN